MTKILSIETSCDETSLAVVSYSKTNRYQALSHITHSQASMHDQYGGVYPAMARREHQKNIIPLLFKTLEESGLLKARKQTKPISSSTRKNIEKILERDPEIAEKIILLAEQYTIPKLKAVAVTYGPGLEIALWTGFNTARALSVIWNTTLVPTNHMEGHIYASLLAENSQIIEPAYPALALLISGGHTELVLTKQEHSYTTIGETLDDAVGECYDKSARLLGLPYPGGPHISQQAELARRYALESDITLPRPMLHSGDLNFSFSGLKTAVRYIIEKQQRISKKFKQNLAREFEEAVAEVLIHKTRQAIEKHKVQSLVVGGGVSANNYLREQFRSLANEYSIPLFLPDISLSGDNALMINIAAYRRLTNKKYPTNVTKVEGNLEL